MTYPDNEVGKPVSPNPAFNDLYQSVLNIKTGPGLDWEKSFCKVKTDWALTYDDGPSQYTPDVVEQLTKRNFKGTFFVVGSQVKKHPEILLKAYQAGMEIGIHTWTHPVMTTLSNEQIVAELMYTYHIIKDIIGVECRYFRAPYGTTDGRLRGVAQALGFVMIRWNRDTGDATTNGRSLKPQFDAFMKQPIVGTISLEHDLHLETAQLASYGMDKLSKSPYSEKTVSECIGEQPYRKVEKVPTTTLLSKVPTTTVLSTISIQPSSTSIPHPLTSVTPATFSSIPASSMHTQPTTRPAQSSSTKLCFSAWILLLMI
ncbi:chitin deacetylase [Boothiomyces macroporosus]|uniref:Chitin deacetylase n=1 Tax=Boothiomyces macroporosus TaxID=261099 RepID=A0AAD5UE68_9FUNG|nr:chitin deacetylase [Boothiomyces macroporosus]